MNYVFSLLNTRVPLRQCLQGVTKECLGPVYRHFVWASLVLNLWSHLWRRLSVSEFKFREWKWWVEKEWSDHEFCLSVLLSENSLSDRSFSTIHFHRVNFNWLDHCHRTTSYHPSATDKSLTRFSDTAWDFVCQGTYRQADWMMEQVLWQWNTLDFSWKNGEYRAQM